MSGTLPARGLGSVIAVKTVWWRRWLGPLVIGVGIGGALVAVTVLSNPPEKKRKEATLQPATALPDTYKPAEPPPIVRVAAVPTPPVAPVLRGAAPAVAVQNKPPETPSFTMTSWHRGTTSQLPIYMQPKPPPAPAQALAKPEISSIAYKADTFDGTTAFVMQHPELVLPQWSSIACVLETGVITGVGGVNPFRCRLPADVTSPAGVVLMEKGTIIGGTYSNTVAEGQTRIVAVAANARTPNNVVVPLGGPMADGIGQAGVEGTVDNHWWTRLGGALVLSLLDAGTQIASGALQSGNQNGGNSLNFGSGLQGMPFQQTAERLLDKTINIPPTITLKQGVAVTLWTTRWVDFSHVYALDAAR